MIKSVKRFFRYFSIISGQIFGSPVYWVMCGLFVIVGICGATVNYDMKDYTVLEVLLDNNLYSEVCKSGSACADRLFRNYSASEWFSVILPVLCAFPFYRVYITQTVSVRYQYWSRLSVGEYTSAQFFSGFVSGFSVALGGILIYGGLMFALFPAAPALDEDMMIYIGLSNEEFIKKILNCCLAGGVFPIVSIVLRHFVRDDFLAMTIPMMIQYLSYKVDGLIAFAMFDPITYEIDKTLGTISALMPSNCLSQWSVWEYQLGISLPIGLFVFAAVLIALYLVLTLIMRRSIRRGS